MPPKKNPLKLNTLQLKTLTILQVMARDPNVATADEETGDIHITEMPMPHGNHFHVGQGIVMARDATGLGNPSVFEALGRKGLVRPAFPRGVLLTPEGSGYETGLEDRIILSNH
jgi:hypothetical protein